jgi:hypothetical protein
MNQTRERHRRLFLHVEVLFFMIWDILDNYLLTLIVGVIIGVVANRYFYKKTTNHSIGQTIEGALISGSVGELFEHAKDLELLLDKMRKESDNLLEEIKRCVDIEYISYEPNKNRDVSGSTPLNHEKDEVG